ncbi:MAG: hypothetical protein R3B70_44330 [Polyangiaceae bacterium]
MIARDGSRPTRTLTGRRLIVAVALAVSAALHAPAAPAQSAKVAAESLFQAGKKLMGEKKYAEACPKFAESQKLDPSPGTQLNLARCYESLGKTASAFTEYKEAAVLAGQLGQKDREQGARDLAKQLEPKLSRLTITAAAVPGLVVKSDGVEMGAAMLGTPLFVDPGDHTIEAAAPGYEAYTITVNVGPNADSKTAAIPPLTRSPEPAPTAWPRPQRAARPRRTPRLRRQGLPWSQPRRQQRRQAGARRGSGMRTASCVLMGVEALRGPRWGACWGLAAADVGRRGERSGAVSRQVCSPAGRAVINDAGTKALVSTIALPVGLAAAGRARAVLRERAQGRRQGQ